MATSASTVPEHFSERTGYIQRIVNAGANKEFHLAQIQFLVSLLSEAGLPHDKMLQKVSEASSLAHTAPPVSKCVVPECQGAALSRPHPPITATIFTVNCGPLPALKCSLRCSKCGTVYKNKQRGEQYYHESRKYVEVSDVVYCERELF